MGCTKKEQKFIASNKKFRVTSKVYLLCGSKLNCKIHLQISILSLVKLLLSLSFDRICLALYIMSFKILLISLLYCKDMTCLFFFSFQNCLLHQSRPTIPPPSTSNLPLPAFSPISCPSTSSPTPHTSQTEIEIHQPKEIVDCPSVQSLTASFNIETKSERQNRQETNVW